MLQGWDLTDSICPTPECCTPLMRAPIGRPPETFCAKCDGGHMSNSTRIGKPDQNDTPSVSSASSVLQSKRSRASTPPTDISSSRPHDPRDEEFVLPPPTEEMLARRAQSDYASAEIGKKLLQGWAMLADECPNPTCYGVPLLRPPRRLTDSNLSTKECVVCKRMYVDAPDGTGLRLQESHPESRHSTPSTGVRAPSSNAQELNMGQRDRPAASIPAQSIASSAPVPQPRPNPAPTQVSAAVPPPVAVPASLFAPALSTAAQMVPDTPLNLLLPTKNPTVSALHITVTVLTARLNTLTSSPPPLNVVAIGEVSDALSRTLDAMDKARKVFG